MLLVYAGGWGIVPGALAGLVVALARPLRRAELAFGAITVLLAGALLLEAGQIAGTDSQRFQERYLFALVPLLAVAFGLYVKRGLPWRVSDAPREFIDSMLKAIVGIEIPITRIVGKWKVSQNRPAADRLGVVAGLQARGDAAAQEMARLVDR